jgi:orotate phosphoribosyltransferase-like protein
MKRTRTQMKQTQQIVWRQAKVLELAADGFSEREIASQLKISDTTIHRDIVQLRSEARDDIRRYIKDQVPYEYKKTVASLESIIKRMSKIINESHDNKEIMQASTIKAQVLNIRIELVASGNLVEEAIDIVERYQEQGQGQEEQSQQHNDQPQVLCLKTRK